MRLLSESGTNILKLSNPGVQSGELLNVANVVSPTLSGLDAWKLGVIFAISDIRLQIKLTNTLSAGNIPSINYEDSTATRLSASVAARNSSPRVGLEFFINGKTLGLVELKNYEIIYSLPVLGKFGREGKFLNKNDILTAQIVSLGYGTLALNDYINISIDYIYELDGFKPDDDLLLKFE